MGTKIIKATCIKRIRDNKNNIIAYTIKDLDKEEIKDVDSAKLKQAIKDNKIYIDNLTLTSDDRLIEHKVYSYDNNIDYPVNSGNEYYTKNNQIIICHGSANIIKAPIYGEGEPTNDYGLGFYTVFGKEIELAKEWACSPYNDTGKGYVNSYMFNTHDIKVLNLDKMDIIYWIVLTATYRKPNVDASDLRLLQKKYLINTTLYDCICGWRCDDTFSRIITTFMDNRCSDEAIKEAVQLGHLKQQYVIMSERAFSHIQYLKYDEVRNFDEYRAKFNYRKERADKGLNKCISNNRAKGKYLDDYIKELK